MFTYLLTSLLLLAGEIHCCQLSACAATRRALEQLEERGMPQLRESQSQRCPQAKGQVRMTGRWQKKIGRVTRGVWGVKEAVVSGKIPYQSKVLVSEQWDTNSGREVSGWMNRGWGENRWDLWVWIHSFDPGLFVWGLQNCPEDTGFLQIKTYISVGQRWDSWDQMHSSDSNLLVCSCRTVLRTLTFFFLAFFLNLKNKF